MKFEPQQNNSSIISFNLSQLPSSKAIKKNSADRSDGSQGRWTKSEHQNFVEGLKLFGKNWKKVQQFVGTRNGTQIRSHAQKFLLRLRKIHNDKSVKDKEKQKNLNLLLSEGIYHEKDHQKNSFQNNFKLYNLEESEESLNIVQNLSNFEINQYLNCEQLAQSSNAIESSDCESLFEHILKFLVSQSIDNKTLIKPKLSDFTEYKPTISCEIRPNSSPVLEQQQFTQNLRKNSFKPYNDDQENNQNSGVMKQEQFE